MKVPKTFTPDKDLDQKVEELNKETRETSADKLLENDMHILYGDTIKYSLKQDEIKEKAIEKIIKDTFEGKIKWKKDPVIPERYSAYAKVENHAGTEILIPVLFVTDDKLGEGKGFFGKDRWGYLHLGDERGPCRNTHNESVRKLATKYFGLELDKHKKK